MYPREFEYVAPTSLQEALDALNGNPEAKIMAGGMSLLPMMKLRLFSPALIIDIGRIGELAGIDDKGDYIRIGALARTGEVAASPLIQEHARALAQAASWTGDVQVRNRGTTAGTLAHADVAADQPAAAMAVGGVAVAQSAGGTREISCSEFCVDALTSALTDDEILVEVRIPKGGGSSAYDKLGRRGGHTDYAVAGAAAWVSKPNGTIEDARIALTGVGTRPALAPATMSALVGSDGSPEAVAAAADQVLDGVTVLEDLYGSVDYKSHLAKVYTRRAIEEALAG